jgi:hypothetical protein
VQQVSVVGLVHPVGQLLDTQGLQLGQLK